MSGQRYQAPSAETPGTENDVIEMGVEETSPSSFLDLSFLLSIINPREIFLPCTSRKVLFHTFYLLLGVAFFFLEQHFHLFEQFSDTILEADELFLAMFLYGYEPALMLINLMFANYPDRLPILLDETQQPISTIHSPNGRPLSSLQQKYNGNSAIVIPSHKNARFIKNTITACLKIVHDPKQIIVVDNGNSDTPLDETPRIVKSIHPDIQYVWVNQGNKTIAQYIGVLLAKPKYPYVLTIDDDVLLSESFVMPIAFVSEDIQGFCIPVRAINSKGKRPIFTEWQDIEYKKSDFWHLLENNTRSVSSPHGAISFWKTSILESLLLHHNLIFYGEDLKLGLIAQHCVYNLGLYPYFPVDTVAPETILGTTPNWWGQRVRSWEMIRHARLFSMIRNFLTTSKETCSGTLMLKLSQFNMIYANIADYLRFPVLILFGSRPSFWIKFGIFQAADMFFMYLWNTEKLKYHPEWKASNKAIFTYWLYKQILQAVSIPSLLRALFIYLPNAKTWQKIPDQIQSGRLNISDIQSSTAQILRELGLPSMPNARESRRLTPNTHEQEDSTFRHWRLQRYQRSLQEPDNREPVISLRRLPGIESPADSPNISDIDSPPPLLYHDHRLRRAPQLNRASISSSVTAESLRSKRQTPL